MRSGSTGPQEDFAVVADERVGHPFEGDFVTPGFDDVDFGNTAGGIFAPGIEGPAAQGVDLQIVQRLA